MNVLQAKNKQGFTIIEVVLVLAIAALIFLMVFIALPALQRNQRDTARKTVLGKVASAVTSFQSNNRGNNPPITAPNPAVTTDFPTRFSGYVDGTRQLGTALGVPAFTTNGIGLENNTYHLIIRQLPNPIPVGTPTAAFQFNNAGRIGAAATAQTNSQIVEIVTRARCNAAGTDVAAGNSREAAVLIGLENGNASLCQNV